MNLNVRRQDLAVQFVRLCLNSFEDVLRLLPAQHENDAFNRIVIFLEAEFAEARSMTDGHISDITHPDGHALVGAHYDVANVICVPYQPYPANVVELSALRIETAASIGVIGSQCGHDLRNRQVIAVDAGRIKQHLILHHGSAEP